MSKNPHHNDAGFFCGHHHRFMAARNPFPCQHYLQLASLMASQFIDWLAKH